MWYLPKGQADQWDRMEAREAQKNIVNQIFDKETETIWWRSYSLFKSNVGLPGHRYTCPNSRNEF